MAKKSQAQLLSRLQREGGKSFEAARRKAPAPRGSRLPPGLIGAVAEFTEWKLDENKNGDLYLILAGSTETPEEYKGCRAQVMHTLAPGKAYGGRPGKTIQDKYDAMSSDIQLMGIPISNGKVNLSKLPDLLNSHIGNRYRFNTWQPDGSDDVMVFIQGPAEGGVETDEAPEVVDDEDQDYEEDVVDLDELATLADEGDAEAEAELTAICEVEGVDPNEYETWAEVILELGDEVDEAEPDEVEEDVEDEAEEELDEADEDISLQDQGSIIDDGEDEDGSCEENLTALCEEYGVDANDYETWSEVADALVEAGAPQPGEEVLDEDEEEAAEEDDEEDTDDEEEDIEPEVGEEVGYKPPRARKSRTCIVKTVNAKQRTVTLEDSDSGDKYSRVSWDSLEY